MTTQDHLAAATYLESAQRHIAALQARIEQLRALTCRECGESIEQPDHESVYHESCLDPQFARLQARIDVLEQERDRWQSAHDVCCNSGQRLVERIDVLEQENERLRAALHDACDELDNMVGVDDEATTAWRALL